MRVCCSTPRPLEWIACVEGMIHMSMDAYQSTALVWPDCVTNSGARYSGVPHSVLVFWPVGSFLANPKSAIFT